MSRDNSPTPTVLAIGELHLEGNVIPHSFFTRPEFKSDRGVTQHVAIMIYADDLYWYRPTYHRDELTGQVLKVTRKFSGDKLQRTYEYYASLFGITKQQATDAVKFLVDRGLTSREFRTIRLPDGRKASNVMFVEPNPAALKVLLQPYEPGGDGWTWVAEPPKPNLKKEKGGIPNKTDTYPEYSGYLSSPSGTRIRNRPETNTETSTQTSQETSQEREAAAPPARSGHTGEGGEGQGTPEGSGSASPVQGQAQPPAGVENKTTSSEKVPGAAAGRTARGETEKYLRKLLSNPFVDRVLDEIQPLGVNRRTDWFALPLDRAQELAAEAQRTHLQHNVKVPTRLKDLLDEECRRRNTPAPSTGSTSPSGPTAVKKGFLR